MIGCLEAGESEQPQMLTAKNFLAFALFIADTITAKHNSLT